MNKLIYILNHYALAGSSHFNHVIHLLEEMAKRGVTIALIIEKCEDIPGLKSPNIQLYPINTNKFRRIFILSGLLIRLKRQGFKKVFIRINWRAALISSIISRLFTRQKVFFWHSSQGNLEYFRQRKPGIRKRIAWFISILPFNLTLKMIHHLVTGPESMVDYYAENYPISKRKIELLYNDIDLDRFYTPEKKEKEDLRVSLKLPLDKNLILFVHRFSPVRKSTYYFPFISDAFFEQENGDRYTIIMIGGGPEKKRLQNEIKKKHYHESILFLNQVPNSSIDQYYKACDVFIQPSFAEGFPRTMLEAMACGLPLVTTGAGGIRDILGKEQKQFMVDIRNREDFVEKLIHMVRNEEKQRSCIVENLEQVQNYGSGKIAEMYISNLFINK